MLRIPRKDPFDAIASRTLEVDGKPALHIRLGRPQLAPDGTCWFCPYEAQGLSIRRRSYGCGADAMQALVLTLYKISVEIETCEYNQQGRLSWSGDFQDFGFPSIPIRHPPEN